VETIKWIKHHAKTKKCVLNKKYGECNGVFLPTKVSTYYKLKDVDVRLKKDLGGWKTINF